MLEDLSIAFRSLSKSPAFTGVALVVLALSIGAGTAIFSVVDAVVLRGLPFEEHDRLAVVLEHDPKQPKTFGDGMTTSQMFVDWRREQQPFEALAVVGAASFRLKNESGEPAEALAQRVAWEFFPVLRVAPLIGRTFTADDEIEGRHRVVILGHGFWQRRFGGSSDVVGMTMELNEETWEIVGVMPSGFSFPVASDRLTEIYVPVAFRAEDTTRGGSRNYNWLAIGRLKAGITIGQAHEQMYRLSEALDAQHPNWSPGQRTRVLTLHEHLVGRVRGWMLMLLAAVGVVLLIACTNVANLALARATVRGREVVIRAALGASRWHLLRGLILEGLALSLAAAAAGVLLAWVGVQVLRAWLPPELPRVAAIAIDLRVLGAMLATTFATGILFTLVPVVRASQLDLSSALREGSRSATGGAAGQRARNALVVAEMALAVVLLVGAGLFTSSFVRLMRVDLGFEYHNVLTLNVAVRVQPGRLQDALKRGGSYVERMVDAVRVVPSVESVAAVSGGLPLTGNWSRTSVELPGRGELKGDDDSIDLRTVSANYLPLMRVPLRRGRNLSAADTASSQPVVVINEAAARKYWPDRDALGERLKINNKERLVVGVVGDIRHLGPEMAPRQEAYVPIAQNALIGATLVLRTKGDPLQVLPAVKAAVWSVNPEQRVNTDAPTLDHYMDRLIAQRRFSMTLLALFGALGLVIAVAGIYAVMAYVVAQRTSEIGVRMALGATRADVVAMVLQRAGLLLMLGLVVGAAVAWYLSAGVKTFLFGVEPNDIRVFAAAVALLMAAGLGASAVPARRAASVDPVVALRVE